MKLADVKKTEIMQKLRWDLTPQTASINGYLISWQTVNAYEFPTNKKHKSQRKHTETRREL